MWQTPRLVYLRSKTMLIGALVKPFFNPSLYIDWYELDTSNGKFEKMGKTGPTLLVGKGTYRPKVLFFGGNPCEAWCHPITISMPLESLKGDQQFSFLYIYL